MLPVENSLFFAHLLVITKSLPLGLDSNVSTVMEEMDYRLHKGTNWHALTVAQVESELRTNTKTGLSSQEVASRKAKYGPNALTAKKGDSSLKRFLMQFNQALVYILVAASLVTFFLGEYLDAGVIFFVVLINAVVGYLQEAKAIKAIEALAKTIKTECSVLRDGERVMIDSIDLVPGDIVYLQSGDKAPADMRLFGSKELQMEEAALTGESLPVAKSSKDLDESLSLGDRSNMSFASTLATYGSGAGIVTSTGDETEVGRISGLLADSISLATPLTRKIHHFSRILLGVILVLATVTFAVGLLRGQSALELFMASVALSVAAIPEGLPAAITIMLAIGVNRMAKRNAIIRKLPAVEALGSTTIICSDKTGTLTQNQMTVERVIAGGGLYRFSGSGYNPEGEISPENASPQPQENMALEVCLLVGALCNDSTHLQEQGAWDIDGDPTEGALLVAAKKLGMQPETLNKEHERLDTLPFESQHAYMATLCADPLASMHYVCWKGSVESALKRCAQSMDAKGNTISFDAEKAQADATLLAKDGMRVLAFALKRVVVGKTSLDRSDVESDMVFLGLQGMIDPPRPEVIDAVSRCQSAGMQVKMITGDHVVTAEAIAHQIGIGKNAKVEGSSTESIAINGSQLDSLNKAQFKEAAKSKYIFARASPEQKLRLVEALQEDGQIVAMTGDGVNDAPALKRADIGIAMGIRGTEVSKEASDMVLADDNFASIVAAVEEGRGVFRNLVKFITWTLPTNVAEALVILSAIAMGTALPIAPVQILWINMSTAILLGMMLAFEPRDREIMKNPPRDPKSPILNGELIFRIGFVGILLLIGTYGVFLYERRLGMELEMAQTLATNTLVFGELFYLFACRSLRFSMFKIGVFSNQRLLGGVLAMAVLQLAFTYFPLFQQLFHTRSLPPMKWLYVLIIGLAVYGLVEVEKTFRRRMDKTEMGGNRKKRSMG